MLTDEERYRFDLQGFLVRRGVLSGAEIAQVHEQIDGLNLPAPGESVQSQRFTGLLEAGGLLRNLVDHDAVLDVVREFCGPQVRLDHAYGIVMAPGTAGLGLHGGGVVAGRRGHAAPPAFDAVGRQHHGLDLRAAEVDAERVHPRVQSGCVRASSQARAAPCSLGARRWRTVAW